MFFQFSSASRGSCNHHKEIVAVGRTMMDINAVMKLANVEGELSVNVA
jgi:hypothetical protein